METILITGAEGMIARLFEYRYKDKYNIRFYSRRPEEANEYYWDPQQGGIDPDALQDVDHIIHLSGARLADHRWTPRYRDEIITSRAGATALLGRTLMNYNLRVRTFISASATGIYGSQSLPGVLHEGSPSGTDFLAEVCKAWEEEAYLLHAEHLADRVCIARFGMVFAHHAGILPKMAIGTKWGIAPIFGSGKQFLPWIHISDLCRLLEFMVAHPHVAGVYNAVAPDYATYERIVSTLACLRSGVVNKVKVPGLLIRRYLQEAADMVLKGYKVSSDRIVKAGFQFCYPDLTSALRHLYNL